MDSEEVENEKMHRQAVRRKYEDAFQSCRLGEDQNEADDSLEEHIIPQATICDVTAVISEISDSLSMENGQEVQQDAEALPKVIPCGVITCFQTFTTLKEYSSHYNRRHMHVCAICKKSLPTSHILELHVLELHDTYFSVIAQKKPMYACLLETCKEKFQDVQLRKTHCLEVHKFPEKFQYWEFLHPEKKSGKTNCKSKRKGEQSKKGDHAQQSTSPSHSRSAGNSQEISSDSSKMSSNEVVMGDEAELNTAGKENSAVTSNKDNLFIPSSVRVKHLSFGRSAPRVFKSNYSFGLPKNPCANGNDSNSSASPTEDNMDLTDVEKALVKIP